MHFKTSEIAAVALFSALTYAGGLALIAVPNLEVVTAFVFLSGVMLGKRNGLLVGLIAQTLYATLNPFGISPFPLLIAQVLNRMIVGLAGGFLGDHFNEGRPGRRRYVLLGITGLFLTFLYDMMAFVSFYWIAGFNERGMLTAFTAGVPFYLIHAGLNTAIFALALPFVIKGLQRSGKLSTVRSS